MPPLRGGVASTFLTECFTSTEPSRRPIPSISFSLIRIDDNVIILRRAGLCNGKLRVLARRRQPTDFFIARFFSAGGGYSTVFAVWRSKGSRRTSRRSWRELTRGEWRERAR